MEPIEAAVSSTTDVDAKVRQLREGLLDIAVSMLPGLKSMATPEAMQSALQARASGSPQAAIDMAFILALIEMIMKILGMFGGGN